MLIGFFIAFKITFSVQLSNELNGGGVRRSLTLRIVQVHLPQMFLLEKLSAKDIKNEFVFIIHF
jgi:hypothetical protein